MLLFQIFRCPWFLISVLVSCYGSLQPGFSQLQRGHRLDRKLIQSFAELSFLDCVIECLVTPRCKSVNYFKGANFCEINYENKTTADEKYMDSAGWVYSEKEHWPKELAGACSNSKCEINQTCKHKRYSEDKLFECVLSDCGIPDQKGIDLNTTRREDAIGIHRRIHASCANGYFQSGSGRLICQSNGKWKYNIVCEDIDECLSNPCQNDGTCINNDGSFTCMCARGWRETLCNQVDGCQNDPCLNGAICTNTPGSFTCTCDVGWTGIVCDEDINECLDNPCHNGVTCSNNDGSFKCICAGGFTGALCNEVLRNIALRKPAEQSSTFLHYNAAYAVDGNRGTDVGVDKCTFTADGDRNPWWRVDLQTVYSITSVRILNRGIDLYNTDLSYLLLDVTVTVGLTESDVNTPCGFFAGPGTASQLVVIDCPISTQGRYVKISKTTKFLSLCEVDVFGVPV